MRVVFCKIDPFTYDQEVFIYDEHSHTSVGKAPIEFLPELLVKTCNEYSISEITLTGIDHYANNIAEKTLNYSKSKYSNMNITVTVR